MTHPLLSFVIVSGLMAFVRPILTFGQENSATGEASTSVQPIGVGLPGGSDEVGPVEETTPVDDEVAVMPHHFIDITDSIGLSPAVVGTSIPRCLFADFNNDGYADVLINRDRVFLNLPVPDTAGSPIGRSFSEVVFSGLPMKQPGSIITFADLDNDGNLDAVITQSVDGNNAKWKDHHQRTAWRRGNGDGTFETIDRMIYAAPNATTSAVGIGDVNLDGKLDLFLGNWYLSYGESYASFPDDLLLQAESSPQFPDEDDPENPFISYHKSLLPSDGQPFTEEFDLGGRPTYGAMIANLDFVKALNSFPQLIELNYGRRWNRVWRFNSENVNGEKNPWEDMAPAVHLDGDDIRDGKYPEWLKERAKTDKRFDRPDEPPFRANGNTFDCSVSDVDNDGDFDIYLSNITHGWAGDSADRSRLMLNQLVETGKIDFEKDDKCNTDRIPENVNNWNQGDLFCQLADLDNDGLVDLLLSSGDYPDNQRLRFYRQQADHSFVDETKEVGLDHDGSQQISLADINHDGALDIIVGQTFNRYPAELRKGREPRLRVFLNEAPARNHSIILRLHGDPKQGTNADALGAIVTCTVGNTTMMRQLIGVGGHNGKQMDFIVHFGIGEATTVDSLTIIWPNAERTSQTITNLEAGTYFITQDHDPVQSK